MQIGWIGTGVMGNAMCGHLINSGHQLYIFNRTRRKAENLLDKGAKWCTSPRDIAIKSQVIFIMVGYPQDVEETIFGPQGVLAGVTTGAIIVDMTTSSPQLAHSIYEASHKRGAHALDAPVSGGDIGAQQASLAIMAGGDPSIFQCVLPLFQCMGKTITHMGSAGSGQHTKMCNQILVAGNMLGAVESLLYAQRVGMDLNCVIDVIGKGAAGSWAINNLGPRIAANNFNPGFFIKHFIKDMGIALKEAQHMKLALPGLALVNQFYIAAMAQGEENLGTHALYRILARMNNMQLPIKG